MFFTESVKVFPRHADGNVSALYGMKGSKGYKSSARIFSVKVRLECNRCCLK